MSHLILADNTYLPIINLFMPDVTTGGSPSSQHLLIHQWLCFWLQVEKFGEKTAVVMGLSQKGQGPAPSQSSPRMGTPSSPQFLEGLGLMFLSVGDVHRGVTNASASTEDGFSLLGYSWSQGVSQRHFCQSHCHWLQGTPWDGRKPSVAIIEKERETVWLGSSWLSIQALAVRIKVTKSNFNLMGVYK